MTPSDNARVAALARAFAMGPCALDELVARGTALTGEPVRVVAPLAARVAVQFARTPRPRVRDVVALLRHDRPWLTRQLGVAPGTHRRPRQQAIVSAHVMSPVDAARDWSLPTITTVADLAAWLGVDTDELAWFSNCAALGHDDVAAKRHHYHYRLCLKPHGGVRVLEAPQARLKALQRRILTEIVGQVPPYYRAAHGFVKGRSVRTFAAEHIGQTVLLRLDLEDFFPRINGARVQAMFRTLGYPEAVADALGGMCTNSVPVSVFSRARWPALHAGDLREAAHHFARPHLPQGAPTSPALANLCAYRMDCRLTGLADWAGATYSRYADDLAFSGGPEVARRIEHYAAEIGAIVQDEGWRVQHHKTRVMRHSVQQRLTGLVVNTRLNCPRRDIDTLRAILTNCARHGPASQNREGLPDFRAHLRGRIAWVRSVNAQKGERLKRLFEIIDWQR
jgi:RNA-directed DNA polymerase